MKVGDKVKFIDDYQVLREQGSYNRREYYMKLANPTKVYTIEAVTALDEIYLEGETQHVKSNLIEEV